MTRTGLIPPDAEHPHLVVLGIRNEAQLHKVLYKLQVQGILHKVFIEPDRNNELTAIATGIVPEEHRAFFRNYQLLKAEATNA